MMDQAEFYALTPAEFYAAQQTALMRLHLKLTGDVHALVGQGGSEIKQTLLGRAGEEGQLSPLAGAVLAPVVTRAWGDALAGIKQRLEAGRREAALLGLASLGYWHGRLIPPLAPPVRGGVGTESPWAEARPARSLGWRRRSFFSRSCRRF
jgi:hypothetical protein